MYTIKREADLKEDAGVRAASSPGSFSPPICIGADLLTETLTGVAFYCTGKQKTLMPHTPRPYVECLTSTPTATDRQLATRWQGLRRLTGGVRDRGGEVGNDVGRDKKWSREGKDE